MAVKVISLLYTTARPGLIEKVRERWFAEADNDVEMIIVTDSPYTPPQDSHGVCHLVNDGPQNCVTGWNVAADAACGEIFVQVSDDLIPPVGWARGIRDRVNKMHRERPDVALNLLDQICALRRVHHPVLTRECYQKTGYLYPEDFESMFCDNWFYAYHRKHSHFAASEAPFWVHEHRTTHAVRPDAVMMRHESPERYERGKRTYLKYVQEQGL